MKVILVIAIVFGSLIIKAQDSITWMTFDEVQKAVKENPKPILVKVEAHWCGPCKMMDRKVYSNKKFIKHYGDKYYFVRLDGEDKKDIDFNGKTYHYTMYSSKSGIHQLAKFLAEIEGKLNYPTTVILNPDLSMSKRIVGYLERLNFMMWLDSEE